MSESRFDEPIKTTTEVVEACSQCRKQKCNKSEISSAPQSCDPQNYCNCENNTQPGQTQLSAGSCLQPTCSTDAPQANSNFPNSPDANFPDLGERYQILALIGHGGMGTVYKVRDKALGKDFAVKVLNANLVQDQISVKRFEQEAQAASSLTHANLAAVYAFGMSSKGSPYLVMDYLDGETLEEILKKEGFLDVPRALDIFIQASEAIADAHMKGVIHRDIKPSNIIIEKRGQGDDFVKIVDFGIAKVLPSQEKAAANLTQTGDIFGSPLYMSPEQCQGNMQDTRSDIYSLGCLMYETLTGVQPYAAENPIKIILKHVHDNPLPFSSLKGEYKIPGDLEKVIMHCLERDPADRYQSADELVRDLQKVRDGVKVHVKNRIHKIDDPAKKKRRLFVIFGASVTIVLFAGYLVASLKGVGLDAFTDAQNFDNKSYYYYITGQYDKAAPLLEFGIPTYKEHIAADLARGDTRAALRDQTFLAENWQHIGKCYLKAANKSLTNKDTQLAQEEFQKALNAYRQAMPFYYAHGNWKGGSTPEAVQDYGEVLRALNMTSELKHLKAFAAR